MCLRVSLEGRALCSRVTKSCHPSGDQDKNLLLRHSLLEWCEGSLKHALPNLGLQVVLQHSVTNFRLCFVCGECVI